MDNRILNLKEENNKLAKLLEEPKSEQNVWFDAITKQITDMYVMWTIQQEGKGGPHHP
jgi:hypothetical protein